LRVTTAESDATYQWRKNGVSITGAKGSSYTISGFKASDAGRYDVVVTTWVGDVISLPAYIGVASKVDPDLRKATYDWVTLAGSDRSESGYADGTRSAALFNGPSGIAMDGFGNLFVADTFNNVIRRVTQTGVVTTVAGKAGIPGTLDGSATSVARFRAPTGIAVDRTGAVYIADPESNTIRKLTNPNSTGTVSTVAGVGDRFDLAEGLNVPMRIAVDSSLAVYFADWTSIRKVESSDRFSLLYGEVRDKYTGTQPLPAAVAVDASGKLFAAVNDGGDFKIISGTSTGNFVATNYGPYAFPTISDLALGAGNNLFAATESTVQLLGDVSQSLPASGLPVNLVSAVDGYVFPKALTVNSQGTVFAVDPILHTVIRGVPSGLPVFVVQPEETTVQSGTALTLTAVAVGAGTVTYQWFRGGVALAGATASTYSITADEASGGDYAVVASNEAGAVTSLAATVRVLVPALQISVPLPQSVAVMSGSSAALGVGWMGPSSTAFQWFRNGVAVSGGTSATLQFSPAKGSDAGLYRVTLRAGTAVVTSGTVNFTVNVPVSIFNQPEPAVAALQGKPVTLRVSAAGTPPLSYQWYLNGTPISGGTGASYTIKEMGAVSAGTYKVEVRNGFGRSDSETSRVSLVAPPAVTVQPVGQQFVNELAGLTLSAAATGTAPLGYQWRKDGAPLVGGTSAVLSLQTLREQDAGFYDVVVSNAAGSATSRSLQILVNLPPKIVTRPPASIEATLGAAVPLRVVAAGTGPFFYQWFLGSTPITGGTSALYMAKTDVAGTAQYALEVTSPSHPVGVRTPITNLAVKASRAISVLREPVPKTNVIRGTAAVLKFSVDPNPPDALRTTFRLLTHPAGAETGVSGVVPASGEIEVALRSLTVSGSYTVALSREYANGQVLAPDRVGPFAVVLRTMDDAAGTYEVLLNDLNGIVGDGAVYRGMLQATVTKTGAVSGRVFYNEAAALQGALGSERAYAAVVRSFSGAFIPSEADPGKLVCAPRLGVGVQANRQSIGLELDFSSNTVELNGLVRDPTSARDKGECVSQGSGAVRGLTNLTGVAVGSGTVDFSSLLGRHALGSDFGRMLQSGPGADNNATLFAQVLATGKVLWGSRLSGSTGTGSANLSGASQNAVFAQIYQGRTTSTTAFLSTSSLVGQLRFERANGGTIWSTKTLTASAENKMERQSCYIAKSNGVPVFNASWFDVVTAGSSSFNWSEVHALDFQNGSTCRWQGSAAKDLTAFFNLESATASGSPAPLYLTAEDPDGGQTYVWTISVSATGTVRAANYFPSTVQPTLTLRFDRTRGEWTGSFVSAVTKSRCNLFGTVARPTGTGPLRGAGWLEVGVVPATRTGGWKLELTAP
jgi:hypothetical protein